MHFSTPHEISRKRFARVRAWGAALVVAAGLLWVGTVVAGNKVAFYFPEDPDLEALVTARLSDTPEIGVLTRADLPRLAREQKIGEHEPLRVTEADFLVSFEKEGDERLVRISESGTGAVVYSALVPKELDLAQTAEWIALRLPDTLRAVAASDARRISFLGFRFDTDSAEHRSFERRLNLAFSALLQETGKVILMERWRMRDLVFERSLQVKEPGPFWQGAELVDGSISQRGETMSVRLRIRTAASQVEIIQEAEIDSIDPMVLAQRLVGMMMKGRVLEKKPSSTEAGAYQKEAAWLLDHGLALEAVQAAESAFALGLSGREIELLRIKAYALAAYPDDFGTSVSDGESGFSPAAVPPGHVELALKMAVEAVALSREWLGRYSPMEGVDRKNGYRAQSLLEGTLKSGLRVLRAAHLAGHHRQEPHAVEDLRRSLVAYMAILEPALTWSFYQSFLGDQVSYAAYWNATPEDAVAYYRKILAHDFQAPFHSNARKEVRRILMPAKRHEPFSQPAEEKVEPALIGIPRVIGWDESLELRARRIWPEFIKELKGSGNPLTRADGMAFHYASLPLGPEKLDAVVEAVQFVCSHSEIVTGPDGELIRGQLWPVLRMANSDQRLSKAQAMLVDACIQWLQSSRPIPGLVVPGVSRFDYFFPGRSFTRQELETSLSAREELEAQQREWQRRKSPEMEALYRGYAGRLLAGIRDHRSRLTEDAPKDYLQALTNKEAEITREFPELAVQSPRDALSVRRAWLRIAHTGLPRFAALQAGSGIWHGGAIWFLSGTKAVFVKVDPSTFKTEVVDVPGAPSIEADMRFQILGNKIYIPAEKDVWSLDLTSNKWRCLGLPENSYQLFSLQGAVWIVFGEDSPMGGAAEKSKGVGLYKVNPSGDLTELIFSSRRHPVKHPLDAVEAEKPFLMAAGNDGSPIIGFERRKKFYRVSDGGAEPVRLSFRVAPADSGQEGTLIMQTTGSGPAGRLDQVLFISSEGEREVLLSNPEGEKMSEGVSVWAFPQELNRHSDLTRSSFRAAISGRRFYLLVMDALGSAWGANKAELYVFERAKPQPIRVPLSFDFDKDLTGDKARQNAFQFPWVKEHGLVATDQGLVLSGWGMDGFWFIPFQDIDARLSRQKAKKD